MRRIALATLAGLALAACNTTPPHRSQAAVAAFKRANACPATGQASGSCPGYVVDHVEPLCAGGADTPRNMQWQTTADGKAKDRAEHASCRALRAAAHPS